jgi:prepilin-type N-terminal cleavage/methylation domain-containing protein
MNMWASRDYKPRGATAGFTIVELLIVIVVIAILATITIVAYNGIQNRAKESSVQSAASQVAKKVLAFAPLNTDMYPLEASYRTDLGLPADTDQLTYDYFVSDDRKSFCVSTTNTTTNPITAYASTQSGQTVSGRCAKNLVANPSFETLSGANVVGVTTSGRVSIESSAIGVVNGSRSLKLTATYASSRDTFSDLANWGVQPNKTYTVLISYTLADPLPAAGPRFRFNIGNNDMNSPVGTTPVGTRQISWTFSTGSSVSPLNFLRLMPGSLAGEPPTYFDSLMIIEGDRPLRYGDGSLPNWSWTGAPHASSSFGPSTAL